MAQETSTIGKFAAASTATVTNRLQDTLEEPRRFRVRGWLKYMAENVSLPRWLIISILGAVLPGIFGGIIGLGAFMWSVSNQITRIDERGQNQEITIKRVESQGRLNDEHQRQLENQFAEFNGWQRGQANERYRPRDPHNESSGNPPSQ